ncbi:MAG: putative toxin-antitoxin system toxin component, PIN family [Actinobacteria bacterium]|nr:putative toxin-antitoxin system toxin component, PIN family [Actinomycetota bacterium]
MRIVFDTNVIVSAFIARGASREVFEHCLSSHNIFISGHIRNEVQYVLGEKFSFPDSEIKDVMKFLDDNLKTVEPLPMEEPVCRDSTDDPVLGTAISAKADCLISGDEDLLILKEFKGARIIRPGEFWRFEKGRMRDNIH